MNKNRSNKDRIDSKSNHEKSFFRDYEEELMGLYIELLTVLELIEPDIEVEIEVPMMDRSEYDIWRKEVVGYKYDIRVYFHFFLVLVLFYFLAIYLDPVFFILIIIDIFWIRWVDYCREHDVIMKSVYTKKEQANIDKYYKYNHFLLPYDKDRDDNDLDMKNEKSKGNVILHNRIGAIALGDRAAQLWESMDEYSMGMHRYDFLNETVIKNSVKDIKIVVKKEELIFNNLLKEKKDKVECRYEEKKIEKKILYYFSSIKREYYMDNYYNNLSKLEIDLKLRKKKKKQILRKIEKKRNKDEANIILSEKDEVNIILSEKEEEDILNNIDRFFPFYEKREIKQIFDGNAKLCKRLNLLNNEGNLTDNENYSYLYNESKIYDDNNISCYLANFFYKKPYFLRYDQELILRELSNKNNNIKAEGYMEKELAKLILHNRPLFFLNKKYMNAKSRIKVSQKSKVMDFIKEEKKK